MSASFQKKKNEELVRRFSNAVKQVLQAQTISVEENEIFGRPDSSCITNDDSSGRLLFSCLEMVLFDGLKNKDQGIWEAVKYFCRRDVAEKIEHLQHVNTSVGKGRAWVYIALNEKELEGYLHSFQLNLTHMYKYYHKSAMICSCQEVVALQTLISSLDFVSFRLNFDVAYLNFTITGRQQKPAADHGSVAHFDASSITEPGRKVVRFIKNTLFQESSSTQKSSDAVNTIALTAVNHQLPFCAKKYCPNCHRRIELVCLCVTEIAVPNDSTSVAGKTDKVQQLAGDDDNCTESGFEDRDLFSPGALLNTKCSSVLYIKQFKDMASPNFEEGSFVPGTGGFDSDGVVFGTTNDVISRSIKKRKSLSCITRNISAESEDSNFFTKEAHYSNIGLSDPMIGFDPPKDASLHMQASSHALDEISQAPIGATPLGECIDEERNNELVQTAKHVSTVPSPTALSSNISEASTAYSSCLVNCHNVNLDFHELPNVEISNGKISNWMKSNVKLENCGEFDTKSMEEIELSDLRKKDAALKMLPAQHTNVVGFSEQGDATLCNFLVKAGPKFLQNSGFVHEVGNESATEDSTAVGASSLNSICLNGTENKYSCNSSESEEIAPLEDKNVQIKHVMRKCSSESDLHLSSSTMIKAEHSRSEKRMESIGVNNKLETTCVSVTEENQGREIIPPISSPVLCSVNSETPFSTGPFFVDSFYDEATVLMNRNNLATKQEQISSFGGNSGSSLWTTMPHDDIRSSTWGDISAAVGSNGTVTDINNSLTLYLMLEILKDENEEIIELFRVGTGHSEGNWTDLCLLFSDSFLYFLRSGDGDCLYETEHAISYGDLNYTSIGLNDQAIEFAFYKTKLPSPENSETPHGKVCVKIKIDTAGKKLTDLILSTLQKAVVDFASCRQSAKKVCPPVFRSYEGHRNTLFRHLQSEGLRGDVQLYQLVYWVDPELSAEAGAGRISMRGALKLKARTFWGSSWKQAYFVVSGGVLLQYSSKNDDKPEASFELTGNNCIGCKHIQSDRSADPGLEFEIAFRDKAKLRLCGYSDIEVMEWIQCLCMVVSLEQAPLLKKETRSDVKMKNVLTRDALVSCSLVVADRALLLCHEDQHTGFCRTLVKAPRDDISTIYFDKRKSLVCDVTIDHRSERSRSSDCTIFFPEKGTLEAFLVVMNSFSKAPTLVDQSDGSQLARYLEARSMLDNRWNLAHGLSTYWSENSNKQNFI